MSPAFAFLTVFLAANVFAGESRDMLARQEAELRKTKNFVLQGKRVEEFSCAGDLKDLQKIYAKQRRHFLEAENILDNEKKRQATFYSLPPAERQKLAGLFPESFGRFVYQMSSPEVAGDRLTLILSTMMRETDFQLFLDEEEPGEMLKGKGTRAGAGLMQMTAWNEEYVKKWGKHDYDQYASGRIREFLPNIKDFLMPGSRRVRSEWLPMHVDLVTKKDDLRTADQFVKSPYNPVAAFWYGRHAMGEAEKKVSALGIRDMDPANRAAILGFFYNAGAERLKCLSERVKIWNAGNGSNDQLSLNKWESLRPLIYLDPELSQGAGLPKDLLEKMAAACKGKEKCSCLDQEGPGPRSALKANDFKAAVSANYGDHVLRLQQCFSGFVDELLAKYSPAVPAECQRD